MNRPYRLLAVATLLTVGGGVLLMSVVFVIGQYMLQGIYLPRSAATPAWAVVTLAAVTGAGRSLMLLLDWINTGTPPWETNQALRTRRIAAAGAVAWVLVAVAFISGGYLGGEWGGDVGLTVAVVAACACLSATSLWVWGKVHA